MTTSMERTPSSDPPGGIAKQKMQPAADPEKEARTMPGAPGIHTVSAIYPSLAEAEGVRQQLVERGFETSEVRIVAEASDSPLWPDGDETGRDEVLKTVLVDGAIGTAVGTGVGAVGTVALAAASVTLFVASPVVAPLAMLGWFAGLGGVVGAAVGANRSKNADGREGRFSELVMDAIEAGNTALIVRTHDATERGMAKRIITDSLLGTDQRPALT